MAQITTDRSWQKIPTKQLVNTSTGQSEVFINGGLIGDIKVAEVGANNDWKITDKAALLRSYNNLNKTNITEQQLTKEFFTNGTKTFNNDRASVINKNSPKDKQTSLATKQNPVPGVVNPKTGIKSGGTKPTSATAPVAKDAVVSSQSDLLNNSSVKDGGYREYYGNFSYPIGRDSEQDYIKFTMLRYKPKKFTATKIDSPFGDRENRTPMGSVSLPIQPNISDSNTANWGDGSLNSIEAGTQAASLGLMQGEANKVAASAATATDANAPALKSLAADALAQQAAGSNKSLFTKTTGAITNPNAELIFTGPGMRTFTFTFTLSAREPAEAIQIKKIIRFFKQGMSVKRAASSLFLKSPNTFGISYIYAEKEHPWINKIKECALTNFGVNYTPAANYATYEDGSMTSYDLTMQFSELDPIYDDDYNEADKLVGGGLDSSIGY